MNAHQLWATTLFFAHWAEHKQKAPAILKHLYELKSRETARIASGVSPAAKSATGLFESPFNLFLTHNPELHQLNDFIGLALKSAVSEINGGATPPTQIDVYARESWFHITNDGGCHDAHHHHNCSWCGIYYLQSGDGDDKANEVVRNGVNRFYSPVGDGGGYRDFGAEYLENNYFDVVPEDGMLVLFPSFLLHSALPYRGREDRIVISFNCQVFRATEQ